MRRMAGILLALAACASMPVMGEDLKLDSPQKGLGYAVGMTIGKFVKEQGKAVDFSAFLKGAQESYNRKVNDEKPLLLTEKEANDVKVAYKKKMAAKDADSSPDAAGPEISPEKLGYALGMEIAAYLKNRKAFVDFVAFLRGADDTYHEKETLMSPDDAARVRAMQSRKTPAEKNLEIGKAFLADNAKKEGVTTTESGLQYIVLKEGAGDRPHKMDRVKVTYSGMLINGKVFDSSTTSFDVGGVIRGWTEALQLMPLGSKYKLFIPARLAYGTRGSPPRIGPNEVLIFEVELLEIVK